MRRIALASLVFAAGCLQGLSQDPILPPSGAPNTVWDRGGDAAAAYDLRALTWNLSATHVNMTLWLQVEPRVDRGHDYAVHVRLHREGDCLSCPADVSKALANYYLTYMYAYWESNQTGYPWFSAFVSTKSVEIPESGVNGTRIHFVVPRAENYTAEEIGQVVVYGESREVNRSNANPCAIDRVGDEPSPFKWKFC